MSIRVSTLCFANRDFFPENKSYGITGDPLGSRMLDINYGQPTAVEASPIYSSIEVRVRITGGYHDGYDGTATWGRVPLATLPDAYSQISLGGMDTFFKGLPTSATDCAMVLSYDAQFDNNGSYADKYPRDAKKQRVRFFGTAQSITVGALSYPINLPDWPYPLTTPHTPLRYFGFGNNGAAWDVASVDSNTFSDSKWRDLRGSYSASNTSGGVTIQYDWTIV